MDCLNLSRFVSVARIDALDPLDYTSTIKRDGFAGAILPVFCIRFSARSALRGAGVDARGPGLLGLVLLDDSKGCCLKRSAILALADGTVFRGQAIGVDGVSVGEVVFNTAMTGYQEILTDPSYCRQIVTLTYPHIGNTGVTAVDDEAATIWSAGLVVRDLPRVASNWRCDEPLDRYLTRHGVVAIADIDTRALTCLLRDRGAQNGCLVAGEDAAGDAAVADAVAQARGFAGLAGMDLAQVVSTQQRYAWTAGGWRLSGEREQRPYATPECSRYHVVAYDFGVKRNILRLLADRGCRLTVVPAQTPADEVLSMAPDGVFLANGPGDPEPCDYAIGAIRSILDARVPTFGICLGYQLLALASGAKTMKMKFGHHGANHPVQDLAGKRVYITSQNHGFAVDEASLPDNLAATHRSLFDRSLQGVRRTDTPAFGFQGHPEASPGPQDIQPLFDQFIELMDQHTASS